MNAQTSAFFEDLLWEPSQDIVQSSRLIAYQRWLEETIHDNFSSYDELWQWSTNNIDAFWQSIHDHFEVISEGSIEPALGRREMPGAQWFPNLQLNYAENIFRNESAQRPALIVRQEGAAVEEVSWAELRQLTGALAKSLRDMGVNSGDRVASYMPNRKETVVAFLACASIGAIWSSCAPDMGPSVVVDRFSQIQPKVLFATDSYQYGGRVHDKASTVNELLDQLPSVEQVIHVDGPLADSRDVEWKRFLTWSSVTTNPAEISFTRLPFEHPLWVVYSSGTTGLPKPMVHSHGGIVLTHIKTLTLQHDLREGDRLMFLGGTGWIVWNMALGSLLVGASVILYDGNPAWPDNEAIWRFIDEHEVTLFGCGAAFLAACMKNDVSPSKFVELKSLRAINATGSPLSTDAFRWVYSDVKRDVWLASISGGTDIASGFVACAVNLPVYAGEIQCRELGVAAFAFDEQGKAVTDEVGELVVTKPMPSMPIYFWNDEGGQRYLESYFDTYPGIWRHGDWIRISSQGTAKIYGRSDSTINRLGIRIGTAEIYRVIEALPEVKDSLVVDLEYLGRQSYMALFVVLQEGVELDDGMSETLKGLIRQAASPRHVPDEIFKVEAIPYTLTGKKMEVPIRKLLLGQPRNKVANPDAMANPSSLDFFEELAGKLRYLES